MSADIKPSSPTGEAKDWTPRQALLRALSEADELGAVVILAYGKDREDRRGYCSVPDTITRLGLCMDGALSNWPVKPGE